MPVQITCICADKLLWVVSNIISFKTVSYITKELDICDWICKNRPYLHINKNLFYGLKLKLHSRTVQAHQARGYR